MINYKLRKYLIFFPKKFFIIKSINFLKYLIFKNKKNNKLLYKPVTMDIEPTTGCNFRCTMCQVSDDDFVSKNLNYDLFKKFIDQNKQLLKIKLQGMGEPLVNKNFFKMVNYAGDKGICSEITTNGSLLNEKNINDLYNSKLSRITISIDGATKETFEGIRIKSNFDEVKRNCIELVKKFKSKIIRPEISAWCTLQKKNFNEIEKIFKLCKEIGFDKLTYQLYLTDWGKEEWKVKNNLSQIDNENKEVHNILEKVYNDSKNCATKVEIFQENLLSYQKQCSWPWSSTYLSKTGDIVPCCIIGDEKVESFGNINYQSFNEIWNSEKYLKFRDNIKKNEIPEYCKNCYREHRN
tara:strand:- start:17 stop:1069 length:1053 start_codon:yes stop_codon:yes gene_type:complete